jgi:hypothetical protein
MSRSGVVERLILSAFFARGCWILFCFKLLPINWNLIKIHTATFAVRKPKGEIIRLALSGVQKI